MNIFTEKIARCHTFYPKRLTNYVEYDYGTIYYDQESPESHMLNHAVIYDLSGDVRRKVYDVTRFYIGIGIMPVIYTPFQKESYEVMYGHLTDLGYTLGKYPNGCFYYFQGRHTKSGYISPCNILRVKNLIVKLLI